MHGGRTCSANVPFVRAVQCSAVAVAVRERFVSRGLLLLSSLGQQARSAAVSALVTSQVSARDLLGVVDSSA